MASNINKYCYNEEKSVTLVKWKVKVGSPLFYNSTIFSYKHEGSCPNEGKEPLMKFKSYDGGTVVKLLASEGETVHTGKELLEIEPCSHPVTIKDLCAECGQDLRNLEYEKFKELNSAETFSMVHVVPELRVCKEQAEKLGKDDETRLLKNKKLVLLVDLDQTLIHSTVHLIPKNMPGVHHFQFYGSQAPWYHTKLRPHTEQFLENISKFYELHICTFGSRLYAHKIAEIIDPKGKFFSHRILSRDECFDASSKTANIKALFPRGDDMVCIIDDREDVWNFTSNLIRVKPYIYFKDTGDINAPPIPNAQSPVPNYNSSPPASNLPSTSTSNSTPITSTPLNVSPVTTSTSNSVTTSTVEPTAITSNSVTTSTVAPTAVTSNSEQITTSTNASCVSSPSDDLKEAPVVNSTENVDAKDTKSIEVSSTVTENENPKDSNDISTTETSSKANAETKEIADKKETDAKSSETAENSNSVNKNEADEELPPVNLADYCLDPHDADDYLLHLEEILLKVSKAYYEEYNKTKQDKKKGIPNLKVLVPKIRKSVLKDVNLIFSGVIPMNSVPERHHLWILAQSLGARIFQELEATDSKDKITHVVAFRMGTAKVNAAKKIPGVFIVHLDWLLSCAERWEHVDERLFPFNSEDGTASVSKDTSFYRKKRPRSSKKKQPQVKQPEPVDSFSERIFVEAGLSLSQDDIEDMDREIDEACTSESEDEKQQGGSSSNSESSSAESLSSDDRPRGWKKRQKRDVEFLEKALGDADESSDADTIGSVDEEIADAVKNEFGNF